MEAKHKRVENSCSGQAKTHFNPIQYCWHKKLKALGKAPSTSWSTFAIFRNWKRINTNKKEETEKGRITGPTLYKLTNMKNKKTHFGLCAFLKLSTKRMEDRANLAIAVFLHPFFPFLTLRPKPFQLKSNPKLILSHKPNCLVQILRTFYIIFEYKKPHLYGCGLYIIKWVSPIPIPWKQVKERKKQNNHLCLLL